MAGSYVVYCHTNQITGQKYYGMTGQAKVKERFRDGKGYKSGKFSKEIEKYGWDNFDHEILYSNLTREEAARTEAMMIAECDPELRLNVSPGGVIRQSPLDPLCTRILHSLEAWKHMDGAREFYELLQKSKTDYQLADNMNKIVSTAVNHTRESNGGWNNFGDIAFLSHVIYDCWFLIRKVTTNPDEQYVTPTQYFWDFIENAKEEKLNDAI